MSQNSTAPTPNTVASARADMGSPAAPWAGAFFTAAAAGLGAGAGATFGAGAGQVTLPSLMTVSPRMASSSIFTSATPSLALHSSSERRKRLLAYRVEDWRDRR